MYKRVLLPVSGETGCKRALIALRRALKICDGEIIILHVTEPIVQTVGGEARTEMEEQNESNAVMVMGPVIEALQYAGAPFHMRVVPGTPAETINKVADEENVEAIVMFTDGRDGLGDMILGSITERVLRNTSRDLIAVREKAGE
ncbi:MAG: universal stress protein [Desulfovibrio sp.]|nr:universal stress protein [Desulfovibrio sp.]